MFTFFLYILVFHTVAGKMVLCRVSTIARKKPQGQQLDEANPERSEETGLWVCPFCRKDDFGEISEVRGILWLGSFLQQLGLAFASKMHVFV